MSHRSTTSARRKWSGAAAVRVGEKTPPNSGTRRSRPLAPCDARQESRERHRGPAPFSGLIAQLLVSTGDYVTRGMKVAEVVPITPLRIELTVPETVRRGREGGQPVSFSGDAFAGRTFEGKVALRLAVAARGSAGR